MKVLYIISSTYMSAFKYEAEGYSFLIQGYPDLKAAHNGLHKRNIGDVLGFIYFAESLPRNVKALVQFIERADMIAPEEMIFLMAIHDNKGFDLVKQQVEVDNLKLKVIGGWSDVTDIVIKSCFAPFILANQKPYLDTDIGSVKVRNENVSVLGHAFPVLQYNRIFNSDMLELTSEVIMTPKGKPDLQSTCVNDLVLHKLAMNRDMFYRIRLTYIEAHFGVNTNILKIQNDLLRVSGNVTIANTLYRKIQYKYQEAKNGRV